MLRDLICGTAYGTGNRSERNVGFVYLRKTIKCCRDGVGTA